MSIKKAFKVVALNNLHLKSLFLYLCNAFLHSFAYLLCSAVPASTFFIRNHFISNLILDSLKFKKLLKLHVLFIRNHFISFISNLVLASLKFKKLLKLHVLFIRNHFISNLVLASLKFKKLLELHRKSYETFEK